jgi:hypothetical protein
LIDAIELADVTAGHRVEPATAAWTARHRPKLMAALAEMIAQLAGQLCRKWPLPNPCGISLEKAGYMGEIPWSDAGTLACAGGPWWRGGDIRIGSPVDVQKRALSSFQEHALSTPKRALNERMAWDDPIP